MYENVLNNQLTSYRAYEKDNPLQQHKAHDLEEFLVKKAIELEGTCSGEHGIGLNKKVHFMITSTRQLNL